MTVIRSLKMKGFKSFARHTEIPFGKGFNIFLGANGTGKSNICESICFALGRSSAKSLRAEKTANLIYNGGKNNSPAKEAEVAIEFDNSSKTFPIASDVVKVARIVKHNGLSVYKINEETRTRQQVVDLLSTGKVDPEGHNIILQGDIILFTEMKPIERREVIAEISGISVYEDKKVKCINELERVDKKLGEITIILTEREARLKELKKDRDQALKYKDVEKNVIDYKATFFDMQRKKKETELDELNKKVSEVENQREKLKKAIDEDNSEINQSKSEIEKISAEMEEKGEKKQLLLRREMEDIKESAIKARGRIDVCRNEIKKIESRRDQLQKGIEETKNKIKKIEVDKEKLKVELVSLKGEEESVLKQIKTIKDQYGLKGESNLEDLEKKVEQNIDFIYKLNEKRQGLLREKDKLNFQLQSIDGKLKSIEGSEKELETLSKKKQKLKDISKELGEALEEEASVTNQLRKARESINSFNDTSINLKATQSGLNERVFENQAIAKVLEDKKSSKGILGTVAQLGNVNGKYKLALETAAGSRLHNIVVEDDIVASKYIKYLKENKIGFATFLPLNKIKEAALDKNIKSLVDNKEVFGLAIDLIEYDKKYQKIFSYIFGNTLVVKDIETARKVGIGRSRMVTLSGDLVERSGAMIGGYREIKKFGGFNVEEVGSEITSLEKEITRLRDTINLLERKKIENENKILKCKGLKSDLEAEINKSEKILEVESYSKLKKEKEDVFSSFKEIDKGLREFEGKIKDFEIENNKLKEMKKKAREKLKDDKVSKDLENFEGRRLGLRETITKLTSELEGLDKQIKNVFIPENEKTLEIIKSQEKERNEFKKELDDLIELVKKREEEIRDKEEKEKETYGKFKNLVLQKARLNDKIKARELEVVKLEERTKANEQRIESFVTVKNKVVSEIEALKQEFENVKSGVIKRGLLLDDIKQKIREFESTLKNIGGVNLRAIDICGEVEKEYEGLLEKVSKLRVEKDDVLNMMHEIEKNKSGLFMKTFSNINKFFMETFKQLSTKGEAFLELENKENLFEGGVDIKVRITGNKFIDIRSLSGGEKTLTALALIFAIQEIQPSSFYLLDEVDAALDKKNSLLLSKWIQKYSDRAQYIVVSHNDAVITEADQIYGVSMQDGVSKVVSLKV